MATTTRVFVLVLDAEGAPRAIGPIGLDRVESVRDEAEAAGWTLQGQAAPVTLAAVRREWRTS